MRVVAGLLSLLALAGCGDSGEARNARTVVAAFYPLAWAAGRIGGTEVEVLNLTPPGAEPHDIELSPRDVETIRDARLVLYASGGFQPAVEDAVRNRKAPTVDVLRENERDPHVWLDPVRFAEAVRRIGRELGRSAAAADVARELRRLDREYRDGLEHCGSRTVVTTHAAFGRLAARYALVELSLAGRSPESEPRPRELEGLIQRIERSRATTVFSEPLVSDRLAKTVAREAGVEVATLDPIEGLSEEQLEAGEDYLSVMRRNLETLREALGCS